MMDKLGPYWLIVGLCDITEELYLFTDILYIFLKTHFVKEGWQCLQHC